jgi:hypothetical protein
VTTAVVKTRVRVLSVAWESPVESYGGLGTFLSRLLPEMARSGHEVYHYYLHGRLHHCTRLTITV